MKPADLDAMRARIQRAFAAATSCSGSGYECSYQATGTDFTTHFKAHGTKAPEQLEDDFLALFVWVWSLKDYFKESLVARGLRGKEVEEIVDQCLPLGYVADIANRAKHGTLRQSRSGAFAELVNVGCAVPQEAIERIAFAGSQVAVYVRDPQLVSIHATVVAANGIQLDALTVLQEAMHCWETAVLPKIAALHMDESDQEPPSHAP